MARVPIIKVHDILIATVQEDMSDTDALELQENLGTLLERTQARGIVLDISIVETVDSFLGRLLNDIAASTSLLGAQTVVVGMQPAVAITLTELGLHLRGVATALNPEKGLALVHRKIAAADRPGRNRGG